MHFSVNKSFSRSFLAIIHVQALIICAFIDGDTYHGNIFYTNKVAICHKCRVRMFLDKKPPSWHTVLNQDLTDVVVGSVLI